MLMFILKKYSKVAIKAIKLFKELPQKVLLYLTPSTFFWQKEIVTSDGRVHIALRGEVILFIH